MEESDLEKKDQASTITSTDRIYGTVGLEDDEAEEDGASTASTKSANTAFPELIESDDVPLDDDEFNIPTVDYQPTLESILSENEMQYEIYDNLFDNKLEIAQVPEGSDSISITSVNSSDTRSRASQSSRGFNLVKSKRPNSILRHVILKGITSEINSAVELFDAGHPTAMAIGTLCAIGTSHGFAFVFDFFQKLKYTFAETQYREEGGAVSSLAMSSSGTRLLIGFAKGLVLMYDLESGRLLRAIKDCHANCTAVLILRFTDYSDLGLCSDSGGSVFELNFKRTMGKRGCDSRCIFTGSRGEVCTFEPLLMNNYPENGLSKFVIVALATLSKVIVVMIRPKQKVLFRQPLVASPSTLPILSWQMVIIQAANNEKTFDPVLTMARQNKVYFYQITYRDGGFDFVQLQRLELSYQLISLHWLDSNTLALLDTKEQLHVMDVRSEEELESIDISKARLVYASSHFKGLATGGNVSEAFSLAGERACYNSILCFNNQMVLLGVLAVHSLTMRSWHERIDFLVRHQYFKEALELGHELYKEKGKAVVGLNGTKRSRHIIIREKLVTVLDRYIEKLEHANFMQDLNTAKENYSEITSTCINYFVILSFTDPIFDKLYDVCCMNPILKSAYLESLEPFLINDKLRNIPPVVVKDFVSYYEELGKFKVLEECIVHINIESLDIHQSMKMCWTHGLFDAIIYIYNRGMRDFISPLEELMTELIGALSSENNLNDCQIGLGNKILVYISCCLAGRAYPYGDILPELVEKVQAEIFRTITTLHTRNPPDTEKAYPYVRALLNYDTREFLNVLSLSFQESLFKSEFGNRQKQRMVDILLQVMVEQGNYPPTQVGMLFTFLARQLARPDNTLFVSKSLFEQVLEHLTTTGDENFERKEERQQALLELLQAGGLKHFDEDKLLEKCLNAKFYRVCEMLYEKKGCYPDIIDCYVLDESRTGEVFSCLHNLFCAHPDLKEDLITKIKSLILNLVAIDKEKTASIVMMYMPHVFKQLICELNEKEDVLYSLLGGLFSVRDCVQDTGFIDYFITERYIELMCKRNNQLVCSFLKSVDSFRLNETLEICNTYKATEAVVYLLERDGKIFEAFDLLNDNFKSLILEIGMKNLNEPDEQCFNQIQAQFLVIIQFCQRNSLKLEIKEREKLWLPILENIISVKNVASEVVSALLNDMTRHTLSSMTAHVHLATVVGVLISDPSYHQEAFPEMKNTILEMLESCTNEESMMELAKRITETDVHVALQDKIKLVKKGIAFRSRRCAMCYTLFCFGDPDEEMDLAVFQCGHSFHLSCLQDEGKLFCSICHGKSGETTDSQVLETPLQRTVAPPARSFIDWNCESEKIDGVNTELNLEADFKIDLGGIF